MSSTEIFISKLNLSKPQNNWAIVKSTWNSDQLRLEIIHLDKYGNQYEYSGQQNMESLKTNSLELEQPFNKFIAELKMAFSNEDASNEFLFELDNETGFSWFKKHPIKIKYGQIKDLKTEYAICGGILLEAVNEINTYKSLYDEKCKMFNEMNELYHQLKKASDDYVEKQQKIQIENLTKFKSILNEKKVRLKLLEETVNSLKDCSDDSFYRQSSDTPEYNNNIAVDAIDSDTEMVNAPVFIPKRKAIVQTPKITDIKSNANEPTPSTSSVHETSLYDQDTQELLEGI